MDWWFTGVLLGTLSSAWLQPDWALWPWTLLSVALFCWLKSPLVAVSGSETRHLAWLRSLLIVTLGLLCGIQWSLINGKAAQSWNLPVKDYRQPLSIDLRVDSIVEENELRWRFTGRLLQGPADWPQGQPGLQPRIQLDWYEPQGTAPQLGEQWRFQVRLRPAVSSLNQGAFNYQAYLLRHRVRATGYITGGTRLSAADSANARVRQYLYDQFSTRRSELIHADVLMALVLAERQWISQQKWQLLQHTGVAHLMAISGLHLSMVFGFTFLLSRGILGVCLYRLPGAFSARLNILYLALLTAWLAALGYAMLAGFAVATLRALLLISLIIALRLGARRLSSLRLLLRAVVLLLVFDPLAFLDAGFWLSVGAVAAIFSWLWRLPVAPVHGSLISRWRMTLVQLSRLEVMLTLMLLPLSVVFFQGVSWLAPLTNLIAVPVFSFAVLPLTLSAALLFPLAPTIATLCLQVSDYILQLVWSLLTWIQPAAWWPLAMPGLATLVVAGVLCRYSLWSGQLQQLVLAACLASLLLLYGQYSWWGKSDPRLWLHMLDVGQGSALVIERAGRAILIDSGPGFGVDGHLSDRVIIPFLRRRGLTPDVLVLTHRHRDHTGGANALLAAYPEMIVLDTDGAYWPCQWGQQWLWQDVRLVALAPLPAAPADFSYGVNNESCVIQLSYRGTKVLLPGDIERVAEFRLVQRYGDRLQSDVLLVPHHGSNTSSHHLFLDTVKPQWALLSSGYLNRFNMPHADVLERFSDAGVALYASAEEGQVSMLWLPSEAQQAQWNVYTYRQHYGRFWFNQLP